MTTVVGVSRPNLEGLPPELRLAQESINLPEVQEMLRKLSKYNLGICMPHMHDEETGQFQLLPKNTVQVEAGLRVSFRSTEDSDDVAGSIPVAWSWRDDGVTASMVCVAQCVMLGTMHTHNHKFRPE
ncbi:MAG: hypothetical protein JO220_03035 [Hyphomicrobiales bacterium]|nr:hypothetical protein [Hyphomicrobiales bacterium]